MNERTERGLPLATLLDQHREEIAATWGRKVHNLPDSHYQQRPLAELVGSASRGLAATVHAFATGSYQALEEYLTEVSLTRLRMGFDIAEVIEALLLCKEAALPVIWEIYPPRSPKAREAIAQLDACLRHMIGRFGHLYADAMHRSLQEQQRRTALMLEAAQTASGSLELDQVLQRVARGIAAAVGMQHCGIYLMDEEQGVLVPRAGTGDLSGPRLEAFRTLVLDPATDPLVGEVIERKEPVVCYDAEADPRVSPETARALGVKSVLAVPIEVGGRMLGMAAVGIFGDCCTFTPEQIELAWGIANAVALAVDNARLYEETRRRLDESRSLQQVTSALLQKLGLEEVLEIVCTEAQRLTGAQGSSVFLMEDTEWLRVAFSTGVAAPTFERMPIEGSLTGIAVREGRPILSNDPASEPQTYRQGGEPMALLAVPLRVEGVAIGALDVVNKPEGFTEEDLRIINLFADQAAMAIENARLYQQVERLAVMEERQRLARELHDSVTQALYGVTLYAEAATRLLSSGNAEAASDHLRELQDTAQEALQEMRLLIFELRPPVLEREGLVAALQARLEAVEGRAGLETECRVDVEGRLPSEIEEGLYRIAQEALNNILKHAQARRITVHLRQDGQTVMLEIADDGVGFDPTTAREKGGLGLCGMEERAVKLGGRLTVKSEPGGGTRVRVSIGTRGNS